MEDLWKEKVQIFMSNLSPYYIFSVFISVFAIWFSWRYRKPHEAESITEEAEPLTSADVVDDIQELDKDDLMGMDNIQAKIKVSRQQALASQVSANMTPEQLIQEKEAEKAQLLAILNLLKEQQEKFQVSDMQELEAQLSLYR